MDHQELVERLAAVETELSRLREERIPAVDRSSRRRDRRLTLAYVLVTALVVGSASLGSASALAGSNTVFSDDIVDGNVKSFDVANNSLITSDIRDNSIASRDIADETIGPADVLNESLTSEDIAYGTITSGDIGEAEVHSWNVQDGSLHGRDLLNGSIRGEDIQDGNLTGLEVADGSITGADIELFNDNRCTLETLLGTALINADPAVPSTLTTDWIGYGHSCSGGSVQVKRASAGQYLVVFNGNPARLAMVTENQCCGGIATAVVSVESVLPGQFLVQTRNLNGAHVDVDFTIAAF